ncbi:MAG: hypothetical protein EA425_02965, partial [Puniceicoccaceae bacterium]
MTLRLLPSSLFLALFLVISPWGESAEIVIDSNTGAIAIDGTDTAGNFRGTPFIAATYNGLTRFLFAGDLVFEPDDVVTGTGSFALQFTVSGNVLIPEGTIIDVSALPEAAGPGGGVGGLGGPGGIGRGPMVAPPNYGRRGNGGGGGGGGSGGTSTYVPPFSVSWTHPGSGNSGRQGNNGLAGGPGITGSAGTPGGSGFNSPDAGGASATGGSGGLGGGGGTRSTQTVSGGSAGESGDWSASPGGNGANASTTASTGGQGQQGNLGGG